MPGTIGYNFLTSPFGEDQARYLIEIEKNSLKKVRHILEKNSVYFNEIGVVQEKNIMIKYRTLKNLLPYIEMERVGEHHNALDDAKSQALHAIKLLKELHHGIKK